MNKKQFAKIMIITTLTVGMLFCLPACGDSASAAPDSGKSGGISMSETQSAVAENGDTVQTGTVAAKKSGNAGPKKSSKKTGAGSQSGKGSTGSKAKTGKRAAGGDGFEVPEFKDADFTEEEAEGNSDAMVDLSSLSEGYVALHTTTDSKIKFQVIKTDEKEDITYTYSVVNGEDQIFPLQSGDGHYVFKVMENIVDSKYAELYKCEADAEIIDDYDPFLRPNQYADYTEESDCVVKAREFAESAGSSADFVKAVYDYVCKNVTYDHEKASSVKPGYLPDPDETMKDKKGICFDYACLTASMLRSQGIPTKIIFGYVAPDDIYHAWNMFYTEEEGWTTVEFQVDPENWNRIDLTFSANGANSKFIGDGSNYVEAYEY